MQQEQPNQQIETNMKMMEFIGSLTELKQVAVMK